MSHAYLASNASPFRAARAALVAATAAKMPSADAPWTRTTVAFLENKSIFFTFLLVEA
jgi:hypothetical protein